jgi:hypothetical protein
VFSEITLLIDSRIAVLCDLISVHDSHSVFSNSENHLLTLCFRFCGRRERISSFATSYLLPQRADIVV